MRSTIRLALALALAIAVPSPAQEKAAPAPNKETEKQLQPTVPPGPETRPDQPKPGKIPSPDTPLPDKERSAFTLVPLPVIYSDPNIGVGGGAMPVILYHPGNRIEIIAAPSVDYNDVEGLAFTSRIFWFPTRQEELFVYNSQALSPQLDHEVRFHGRDRFWDFTDFIVRGYYYNDITRRFFGFGAGTDEDDETNYQQREIGVEGDIGYRFWDKLRIAGTFRYRRTSHGRGEIDDLDDTVDAFPFVPGVGEKNLDTFALGLRVTLDLRDNAATPNKGLYMDMVGETAPRGMIGEFEFWRWIVDARAHIPIYEETWIHSMRAVYHGLDADSDTPFWELPTLGGASTLRGFGLGRFTDDNYLLFGFEERFRVWDLEIRANRLTLEVAGFFDTGRVFGRGAGLTDKDWQFVPGAGARLLLPDSAIVARIDVGMGQEGPAIFIVLGYPF